MPSKELDKQIYHEEIEPWLPREIIDIHVHIGLAEHVGPISPERFAANWAIEVGVQQSWEQLWESFGTLFLGRRMGALAFGGVYREVDIEANNAYVLGALLRQHATEATDSLTPGRFGSMLPKQRV